MLEHQVLRDIAVGTASWFVWRKESTAEGIEVIVAPVSLGGKVLGSIGAVGPAVSEPALQAIANLVGNSPRLPMRLRRAVPSWFLPRRNMGCAAGN
jgi:hypothetical protein